MNRSTLVSGIVLLLCLAGWGGREWALSGALRAGEAALMEAQAAREQLARDHEALQKAEAECRAARVQLEGERQNLLDRCANLEAQRDHLQTHAEALETDLKAAREALRDQETEWEQAQLRAEELAERPRILEAELARREHQLAEFQALSDAFAEAQSRAPSTWMLSGLSKDHTVFALEGGIAGKRRFPEAVFLCRQEEILLSGWLHRQEGTRLIGHVTRWRQPPSTLVNGEKVFILRRGNDEADP